VAEEADFTHWTDICALIRVVLFMSGQGRGAGETFVTLGIVADEGGLLGGQLVSCFSSSVCRFWAFHGKIEAFIQATSLKAVIEAIQVVPGLPRCGGDGW
jgi:hypothetical protein